MEPIPLPSHVHYELLLQLLERKTLSMAEQKPVVKEQVQQLIISLRKALAQQKQLETICDQLYLPFEYRWSINSSDSNPEGVPETLAVQETIVGESQSKY
jgi:methyl coenzyme M reductase subunit D